MNGQADVMGALEEQATQRSEADHVLVVVAHQLLAMRSQLDAALAQVQRIIEGADAAPRKRQAPALPEVKEPTGVHVFGPVGFRPFGGSGDTVPSPTHSTIGE